MMCRREREQESQFFLELLDDELCLSIQVCKGREIHAVRGKNADCTCTHSTKNKIQRGWYFYSGFAFLFFSFFLFLFWLSLPLPLLNNSITLASLHPVSHSITSRYIWSAVVLLGLPAGLRIQFIQHSSPIDYLNIWLHFSQRYYFGSFKGMNLLCTLISIVYFTSWLDNIGEFRCSMAEIASHYDYVLTFVNYSLSHGKLDIRWE